MKVDAHKGEVRLGGEARLAAVLALAVVFAAALYAVAGHRAIAFADAEHEEASCVECLIVRGKHQSVLPAITPDVAPPALPAPLMPAPRLDPRITDAPARPVSRSPPLLR